MSVDFTTYNYDNKTIRVRFDAEKGKYWFVVVDVLACLFDHPHFYWQKIKEKISKRINYLRTNVNNLKYTVEELKWFR